MPWLGVSVSVDEKEFRDFVQQKLNLKFLSVKEIEIKTRKGWIKFKIIDVTGFVEGYAQVLAERFNADALESGEHLILGEPSAKLWDEAVKVVFADKSEEIIPVYTFDGFLDLRLPTDKVRGLNGYIAIGGITYTLPLKFEDLVEIYEKGKIEKVEKAAAIYGIDKIISKEAILKLKEIKQKNMKVEIDYESGFVFIMKEKEIITKSIPDYVIELIQEEKFEEIMNIYNRSPESLKEEIRRRISDFCHILKEIGKEEQARKIEEFKKREL